MVLKVYDILLKEYGRQGWWPILDISENKFIYSPLFSYKEKNEEEKFEISIGAILTQNTSWKNVKPALFNLKKNNLLNKNKLQKISHNELAQLIKSAGYYNQKAKKIIAFANFDSEITRENLLSIWGIGEETADSILLYAYNKPYFVIDAYTKRIFSRIKKEYNFGKYSHWQDFFMRNLPEDFKIYNEYHALLVNLGKFVCLKKKPHCMECPLYELCEKNY